MTLSTGQEPVKADMTPKTVLVIDDEVLIGELVCDYLASLGFKAFAAQSAVEGISLVKKEKPDLILLDVLMPQVGGIECLKEIKIERPESIVVMVTAVHDENTAKQAITSGAYDYITKPIDFQYLKENVLARVFPDFIP